MNPGEDRQRRSWFKSIAWRVKKDPFANFKPRLNYDNPAHATAYVDVTLSVKARTTKGEAVGRDDVTGPSKVSANILKGKLSTSFS